MGPATLCFLVDNDARKVLLGMKKRGFGSGWYNGYGGKINDGETIEQGAIRETFEECSVRVSEQDLQKVAELYFKFPNKQEWDMIVHVFRIESWQGEPKEGEEMTAEWFGFDKIPYDKMWDDDRYWLPMILEGKKLIGEFIFEEDNKKLADYKINEVDSF